MPFWSDERLEHLEAALDALDDAVMVVDEDLCIVAFNRAAEKLTGFTRQEALGSRCFEVCAGRFCRRVCDIEGLFATRRPPEDFESPVLSKDGRVRLVRVRTVPLTGRGNRILAAVRILRDVTAELGSRPGVDQRERDRCKGYGRLVGASRPMLRLYEALEALRDSEWPILVQGPPGTETDWVALTLHELGIRSAGPFVPVLTEGLPPVTVRERLLGDRDHSEAHGHAPVGALHLAHEGTLFVEDIADLPADCQAALARHLDAWRPGQWPDVRIVAGTHHRLEDLVVTGSFDKGLAAVLQQRRVVVPPLVDRLDDIPLLAEKILADMTPQAQPLPQLTGAALARLMSYPFPGNVRELERILRAAAILAQGPAIDAPHLVLPHPPSPASPDPALAPNAGALSREQLLQALEAHHWQIGQCARALGINRTTLWRRMKRLGLQRPRAS